MMRIFILIPVVLCGGCTLTTYHDGTHSFTRLALGANTQAQTLTVVVRPDGTKELTLGGYRQVQDEAFGAAAEGITTAITKTLVPKP